MSLSGFLSDPSWISNWLLRSLDVGLVMFLVCMLFVYIGERRTRWMFQGLLFLVVATGVSNRLGLVLLNFVLEKLLLGCAVAVALSLQSDFRRFLEQLGRGKLPQPRRSVVKTESVIDEIVEAVKQLSQNRTGALIVIETNSPIDEADVVEPGVQLNAEVSKELLQTIFQTSTLLHDGAVIISGSRVAAAAATLPLSDHSVSRQLGTRHRAAMGLTDRVECLCIVVSEETGSISLAETGNLNRPLTSSKLKELLEAKLSVASTGDAVSPSWKRLSRTMKNLGLSFRQRLFHLPSSDSKDKQ